uniref:Uncharacterized protein n=1 Tax=Grammatophora oceanica TaxID=210454 RepID=A0A7S1UPH0_9STRA|mmetsp:Transcript_15775/g.23246  ORF Transcript_15775/g.23246 Transcript_15775/m.23246 type:complete len:165 (+) Transcript_15775:1130-1624(+)
MRRLLVGAHAQVLLQDRNGIPDDVIEAMGTACEHLQGDGGLDQIPEQLLERVEEHMTRVSPYRFEGHAYPTPRQIVVAASKMGLPNAHVYNSDWWTAENLTKDLEMVHAIRQYTMPRRDEGAGQRMDQLPDEDTWASGDFEDESEESFSIYDEEENTDDEAFSG